MRRALLLLLTLVTITACHRHGTGLRVRVLYSAQNPATLKLQQAEREFSFTDPRLRNAKPFVITSAVVADPAAQIADRTRSQNLDLFILKSAAELPDVPDLRKAMGDSFSICQQAVAYIPEWVSDERREGAARFVQYLSTHCR
jgi:hypothetical protein